MGDKKNAIKKLQQSLRSIKYPMNFEIKEMEIGSPREYLKLYHYLFMDYSPLIAAEILNKHNMELSSKNDKAFIDGVYRIVRDMFAYVPKLTRDQFFSVSFAQVKATMTCEIIGLIQGKLKTLQPHTTSNSFASNSLLTQRNLISSNLSNNLKKSVSNNSIDSKVQNHRVITPKNVFKNNNSGHRIEETCKTPDSKERSQSINTTMITKAFDNFNAKFELLSERIIPLESRVNTVAAATNSFINTENVQLQSENDSFQISKADFNDLLLRVSALEHQNEWLKDRVTILETQNLSNKHLNNQKRDSSVDVDATIFHSFIDNERLSNEYAVESPINENRAINSNSNGFYGNNKNIEVNKNGLIYQGEPVDFEQMKLIDHSLDSNDVTPTVMSVTKTSKFPDTQSSIMRAKDLINKASLLSKDLSSNMKSM